MKLVFGQTGSMMATVRVTFDAGSSVEPGKWTSGIAHLSEHMVFQGSKSFSHQELTRIMARLGVSWNAFTSHSKVSFFITAPNENIEEATKVFSDLILNRELKSEAFEKEKLVVLEEERGSHDDIDGKIYEELDKFLCKGPLAIPILGTQESILSITLEELESFCNTHYTVPKMLVTITSPNPDHQKLGELFGKPQKSFQRSEKAPNLYKNGKRSALATNIQQARVFICYRIPPIKDKLSLDIQFMEHFFSHGMDSRLFQSLRQDRGLCYGVGSFPAVYDDIGWLIIWTHVSKENVEKSMRLINKEVQTLLKEGPTKEEVVRARNKYLSEIYGRMETSYGLNSVLDFRSFYNLPDMEVSVNRIKRMTASKIVQACESVFRPEFKQVFTCVPKET